MDWLHHSALAWRWMGWINDSRIQANKADHLGEVYAHTCIGR